MTLSEFVIKYRKEHSLSLRDFAEKCGLSATYIMHLEKDVNSDGKKPSATMKTYSAIAKAIGMQINDFLVMVNEPIKEDEVLVPVYAKLTDEDRAVLEFFHSLSAEQKKQFLDIHTIK